MKHVVFDVSSIVALLVDSEKNEDIKRLLDLDKQDVSCWISAGSLPSIQYIFLRTIEENGGSQQEGVRTFQELFTALLNRVSILSNLGFRQNELIAKARDLEGAQIALAADQLHGEKIIVTDDPSFDTLGLIESKTALEAMAWLGCQDKNTQIPFVDLAGQQDALRPQLEKGIFTVLKHGKYILGPEVQELEGVLSDYVGVENAIGVASGTDALLAVLMAWGVGPGDAVFTTPFTFIATSEVISLLGATPVFVDIDPRTYNIDPDKLALAVQAVKANDPTIYPLPRFTGCEALQPKAVIPVDLFGLPADYDPIMKIAEQNKLFVLEDAAQGLGGVYKNHKSGSFGHAAATSFFPAKPLGCYGDGGAVMTNDQGLADEIRSIRVHGKGKDKYDNVRVGLNARLHTVQAAFLLAKFGVFSQEVAGRQRVAEKYSEILKGCAALTVPFVPDFAQSAWAQYTLYYQNDRVITQGALQASNIPSAVYYGRSLHLQPVYKGLGYEKGDLPVSEISSEHVLSLPMSPNLSDAALDHIISGVLDAVED
ncbi:MAG: DegT/DnrJ/EryC1/StrS family aminotransferase [Candidatus Electrothrix sp.]